MSSTTRFPSAPTAALLAAVAIGAAGAGAARADNLVLEGPHPFLKENEVTVQYLLGTGIGQSWSGSGVGLSYGYMLRGPLWLDLQLNFRGATCSFFTGECPPEPGSAAEVLAGGSWRFRTDIPVVPYVRAAVGLLYLFPRTASDAVGLDGRGGVGVRYYIFDWFGFNAEAALSLGHGYFDADYHSSHTYAVGDFALGVEVQFQ